MFFFEPLEYYPDLSASQKRLKVEVYDRLPLYSHFKSDNEQAFSHPMGLIGISNRPELFNPLWLCQYGGKERFQEAGLPKDFYAIGILEGKEKLYFAFWFENHAWHSLCRPDSQASASKKVKHIAGWRLQRQTPFRNPGVV